MQILTIPEGRRHLHFKDAEAAIDDRPLRREARAGSPRVPVSFYYSRVLRDYRTIFHSPLHI
jgi:hypothetical protein